MAPCICILFIFFSRKINTIFFFPFSNLVRLNKNKKVFPNYMFYIFQFKDVFHISINLNELFWQNVKIKKKIMKSAFSSVFFFLNIKIKHNFWKCFKCKFFDFSITYWNFHFFFCMWKAQQKLTFSYENFYTFYYRFLQL